ncbi:MAG: choice-of-anchor Q domain-containing protein [Thermoanaerobaculia bacterium]
MWVSAALFAPQLVHGLLPDCAPAATAVVLSNPTVLGNGTPESVTTAAIQTALNAGGEITFDVGSAPVTIVLTTELTVAKAAVLDGAGVVTLSGGGSHRVIRVTNPQNLTYTLRLQNIGIANGATPAESGAGIFKASGGPWQAVSLIAVNCSFHDNVAIATNQDGGGGAIYAIGMKDIIVQSSSFERNRGSNGGALYSLGSKTVIVVDSLFSANHATGTNGNPGNGGNAGAIGIDGDERLVSLCGVELADNWANAFGAGFFSVMYDDLSATNFNACTFLRNTNPTSSAFAGGAYLQGGPFSIQNSSFTKNEANGVGALYIGPDAHGEIVNSTFEGNLARTSLAGAISIGTSGAVLLNQITVAGNLAPGPVAFAAGIAVDVSNAVTMKNSVLVDNVGGNAFNPWNIWHPVGDGGGNLQWPEHRPNGQSEPKATATTVWADPDLEPMALYGGPTPTMPLSTGSPAVNAGVAAGAPATDQRGRARTALPDAGAVEGFADALFRDGFESGGTANWVQSPP